MTKYIDSEKLKAEIERLIKVNKELTPRDFTQGIAAGYADVLSSIESLEQELSLPSTLEEAAFQSADENAECLFLEEWEKAFKAGAEWMASQMNNNQTTILYGVQGQ